MGLAGKVWAEIGGDASGLKKATEEAKQSLNNLKGVAENAGASGGASLAGLALGAVSLQSALMIAERAAQALKDTWEYASEGANLISLSQSSARLASAYDSNMASIVDSVKEASFNMLTNYDIMRGANLAMTMGITNDATEMSQLMQIAIERGRAFGLSAEESFDRITRGIGRRSTKILDDLGFTANAIQANKDYADTLGISTNALTDDMKVRALFEQVLREGNAELAKQGGLTADISTSYQRVNTVIEEFWNNVRTGAARMALPIIASEEDVDAIDKQAASYAILAQNYDDYRTAVERGKTHIWQPELQRPMSQAQFASAQSLTAQANAYKGIKTEIEDYADEEQGLNKVLELKYGLAGQITEAMTEYSEAMKKAGKNTEKQEAAINNLNESYQDFILGAVADLGVDATAQMGIAFAFGEIDANSMAAFGAISEISAAFEKGEISADEYYEMLQKLPDAIKELDSMSADIPITFRINVLVNGMMTSSLFGLRWAAGALGTSTGILTSGMALAGQAAQHSGGMHGGSFVGMQHGGIVPPGFSNDGMPVWVSSGERLDVTPAGNKSVQGGGNTMRFYGPVTFKVDKDIRTTNLMEQLRQ